MSPEVRHVRFARPVTDPGRSAAAYCAALDMQVLGRFDDHDGFDGVMVGDPEQGFHFEFTRDRRQPVTPAPTREDLVVFYVPDPVEWDRRCRALLAAGFEEVAPRNPYWRQQGRSFRDQDGYLVVVQRAAWRTGRSDRAD